MNQEIHDLISDLISKMESPLWRIKRYSGVWENKEPFDRDPMPLNYRDISVNEALGEIAKYLPKLIKEIKRMESSEDNSDYIEEHYNQGYKDGEQTAYVELNKYLDTIMKSIR